MPIEHILVDANLAYGAELIGTLTMFQNAQDRLENLKEKLDKLTDGVVFTAVESQLGLTAGNGVLVYNLIAGAVAELTADVNFVAAMARIQRAP